MNKKEDRKAFVIGVGKILSQHGELYEINPYGNSFIVPTKNSQLKAHVWPENDHKEVCSVFMRYDKPSDVIGNPHSGKHNFHSLANPYIAIEYFRAFLVDAIKKG